MILLIRQKELVHEKRRAGIRIAVREVSTETGYAKHYADGSALISIGDTRA